MKFFEVRAAELWVDSAGAKMYFGRRAMAEAQSTCMTITISTRACQLIIFSITLKLQILPEVQKLAEADLGHLLGQAN